MNTNTKINFKKLAALHAGTCFLNSLLREWNGYRVLSSTQIGKHIAIFLGSHRSILVPIKKYSTLGRHQYFGNFYEKSNEKISEITFEKMVTLLCDFLANHFQTNPQQIEIFKKRVFSSFQNTKMALESRAKQIEEFERGQLMFMDGEQALIIGHNFHPTPKSRDEFDDEDSLKYSPEFGGGFHLEWFMIDPSILYQKCADSFHEQKWTEELFHKDFTQTKETRNLLAKGMIPVPMHPWQIKVLVKNPIIAGYIQSGRMVLVGISNAAWYSTSSLRSIYRNQMPYMLKFSMSLKLTNSIRHLLTREVARGLQLCDVLATETGKRFLKENPNLKIINEPAYLCLKDVDGNPMDESIVMCRENPFNEEAAHGKVMLAALAQDAPLGGKNLLEKLVKKVVVGHSLHERSKKWFEAYLNVAVKPLILAYANYGFVLGAHQQNLILDIQAGLPVNAYFRDCQSVLYSEFGFSAFANEVQSLSKENGNILSGDILKCFFSYHLILNSTFNVITALSASDEISEEELLSDLREFLEKICTNGVRDSSCLDYLLGELHLLHKGNFLCSFRSINENTAKNPFIIYTQVQNSILTKNHKDHSYV